MMQRGWIKMKFMGKIKYFLGLFIYRLAPIRRNRFVFTSFNGHYSDNPKAISNKLHEIDGNSDIVWLVKNEYMDTVPSYARKCNINSLKAFWYRGTSMAQIDNVYGFRAFFVTNGSVLSKFKLKLLAFLSNKKNQPVFSTMHGTPLKKIGRDQIGNNVLDMICPNSYLLVGDQLTADVLKNVTFEKIPIKILGSPRNDILFKDMYNIKKELELPIDKKILLFAPTFRNDGKDTEGKNVFRSGLEQLKNMDFEQLFHSLSVKFGGEWVMVCRFHYHVSDMVDWGELNVKYPGKFINGNLHDDMADYLCCSDALLTDFSSCMFDFGLTGKPCFLYFPDLEHYRDKERGFYIGIKDLPFSASVNFQTLISNIDEYEQAEYLDKVNIFLNKIGSQNDGNASQRVVNYILEVCKKRN